MIDALAALGATLPTPVCPGEHSEEDGDRRGKATAKSWPGVDEDENPAQRDAEECPGSVEIAPDQHEVDGNADDPRAEGERESPPQLAPFERLSCRLIWFVMPVSLRVPAAIDERDGRDGQVDSPGADPCLKT
jgi:hypothetical protein